MKGNKELLSWLLTFWIVGFCLAEPHCGYPGAPAHSKLSFNNENLISGTFVIYTCDNGFELLGPSRRVCNNNGTWIPEGIPFCVANVAAGKAPMQSSVAGNGVPQKAVDGSTSNFFNPSTCTLSQPERAPWWYVNLLEPYMVQLVRVDFGRSCCGDQGDATVVVRVGNNRPDLGVNPVCNKYTGKIEEGKPLFLPCSPPIAGAFVSVQLESPPGRALSLCETFVYTDQALPIDRCPDFRDQPPGSTTTYNGNCYIFYNQQRLNFANARTVCEERGGTLVDDSNPALQGFLSWEMWRRHRSDPSAQYWLGAIRDVSDRNSWKWLNGEDVTVSFWNLPTGNGNCARFDGSKGWLWTDTNCNEKLNYICQHSPRGCGRPEQPPNSTLLATSLEVGAEIEHRCDAGHVLVGPKIRTCLPNGLYSDFPPSCKYLECGSPANIPNGRYTLLNGTKSFSSWVRYSCDENHVMVGRNDLMCDIDQKWNGPPPRCEPLVCPEPPEIKNGRYHISRGEKSSDLVVRYECDLGFSMDGHDTLVCQDGSYDQAPPICVPITVSVATSTSKSMSVKNKGEVEARPDSSAFDENKKQVLHSEEDYSTKNGNDAFKGDAETVKPDEYENNDENKFDHGHQGNHYDEPEENIDTGAFGPLNPPVDNKVSQSNHENHVIRANKPSSTDSLENKSKRRETPATRLNLGGIIALSVFGGFILLAAVITSIVLLIRRKQVNGKHERHRGSPDSHTITSVDSGSDTGLGRLYRRAWDSLAAAGGPPTTTTTITTDKSRRRDTLDFRSRMGSMEGVRDEGEIIVQDALPSRKHHHHHHHHHGHGIHPHHHHHHHDPMSSEWSRSIRSHRSRY